MHSKTKYIKWSHSINVDGFFLLVFIQYSAFIPKSKYAFQYFRSYSFTTQNNLFSQTNYNPKYVLHFFSFANAPTY